MAFEHEYLYPYIFNVVSTSFFLHNLVQCMSHKDLFAKVYMIIFYLSAGDRKLSHAYVGDVSMEELQQINKHR